MAFLEQIHPNWRQLLGSKVSLLEEIESKLQGEVFLPSSSEILKALTYDPKRAKVLILGQDPYPNRIDAMGLAFSTKRSDGKLPASLKNIFIELESDLGVSAPKSGDLSSWCDQGVVLLNRILTCREGEPNSHSKIGWSDFTYEIVKILAQRDVVAILWGKAAQELSLLFADNRKISSVHPSPLSAYRGFFGSKPFSRANAILESSNQRPIEWARS